MIISFIKDLSGTDMVNYDSDIFLDLGMVGDDFHEMIDKYAEKFSVDMKGYLWYFHADEEGQSIGGLFFTPPYDRVKRIPITPTMLTEFANKGQWDIKYPDHKLPKQRNDILVNKILLGLFITGTLIWIILELVG